MGILHRSPSAHNSARLRRRLRELAAERPGNDTAAVLRGEPIPDPGLGLDEPPRLDVDPADLAWWASQNCEHHDVHGACPYTGHDCAAPGESDGHGDEAFDLEPWGDEHEHEAVADYLRPRARSMRVDEAEEARLYGYGR